MNAAIESKIKDILLISKVYVDYTDRVKATIEISEADTERVVFPIIEFLDFLFKRSVFNLVLEYKKYRKASNEKMRKFLLLESKIGALTFTEAITDEFYDFWEDVREFKNLSIKDASFAANLKDFFELDFIKILSLKKKSISTAISRFNSNAAKEENAIDYIGKLLVMKMAEQHYVPPFTVSEQSYNPSLEVFLKSLGNEIRLDDQSVNEILHFIEKKKNERKTDGLVGENQLKKAIAEINKKTLEGGGTPEEVSKILTEAGFEQQHAYKSK